MSFNVPISLISPSGRYYLFSFINHIDQRWVSELFPILQKELQLKLSKNHSAGNVYQISKWKDYNCPNLILRDPPKEEQSS